MNNLNFKKFIYKKFSYGLTYKGGRNNLGRITVRHRGNNSVPKRKFLSIDLKHSVRNLKWILLQIRPSTRRTAYVGLILYENGLFSYILLAKDSIIGMIWTPFKYGRFFLKEVGLGFPLSKAKEGISVFNVENKLGCGGIFGRSAGVSIKILNSFVNKYNKILIKLSSGDEYLINANCMATLGVVSNSDFWSRDLKKAGVKRYYGFRSFVRGVAMNPVDHAHGGRTCGGKFSKTPSGLLTKGVKTRKLPISTNVIFKRRTRRIDYIKKVKLYKKVELDKLKKK